jgi:hypothetical protein
MNRSLQLPNEALRRAARITRNPDSQPRTPARKSSGSLATVRALLEAGASPGKRDTAWNVTPLGWAEYYLDERKDADSQKRYGEIADYLRVRGPHSPA